MTENKEFQASLPDDAIISKIYQLTEQETIFMVSQNAIPSKQHLGGHLPYVFTEQGVLTIYSIFGAVK
jgi:hypothetical protein